MQLAHVIVVGEAVTREDGPEGNLACGDGGEDFTVEREGGWFSGPGARVGC